VQDFDGISVEDSDNFAGEICRDSSTGEKDVEKYGPDCDHEASGVHEVHTANREAGSG